MKEVIAGFTAVLRGAGLLLRTPRLLRLAVLPTLLTLLLVGVLVALSLHFGPALVAHRLGGSAGVVRFAGSAAMTLLLLALSLVIGFFASLVIGQPFVDWLSAATERELAILHPEEGGVTVRALAREGWLTVVDVAADTLWLVLAQLVVLLVWLVPLVGGPLHAVLSWLVNAWFAGAGMVCSPLVRRGQRGGQRWRRMQAMAGTVLGVGLGTLLVMVVPLAQLLTLPVAAVGGTLALVELEQRATEADHGH